MKRIWDDKLKAYVTDVTDEVRRVDMTQSVNAQIDDVDKAIGNTKSEPQKSSGKDAPGNVPTGAGKKGEPFEMKPMSKAQASLFDEVRANLEQAQGTPSTKNDTIVFYDPSAMPDDANKTADWLADALDQTKPWQLPKPNAQSKDEKSKDDKGEKSNAKQVNDIFERWTIDLQPHFCYFVHKTHPDIHIRFAHSIHVPHLAPEINTYNVKEISDVLADAKFMMKPDFRKTVINPLLDEFYA